MTKFSPSKSEVSSSSHNTKKDPKRWRTIAALVAGPIALFTACSSGSSESNDTAPESVSVSSRKLAPKATEDDAPADTERSNQEMIDSAFAWVDTGYGDKCILDIHHVIKGQNVVETMGNTDGTLCNKGEKIATPLPAGFAESLEAGRHDWQQFVDLATKELTDDKGDSHLVYPEKFNWVNKIGSDTHEAEAAPLLYGTGSPEYGSDSCSLFKGDELRVVGTVEDGPDGKPVDIAVVLTGSGNGAPCDEGDVVTLLRPEAKPVLTSTPEVPTTRKA